MLLVSTLFSAVWGLLTYVRSPGWVSLAVESAVTMLTISMGLFLLAALLVARSQRVRLWIAVRRIRRPSWRAVLAIGALWGATQGGIDFAFTHSPTRAALVAVIYLGTFVVFPLLIWRLFARDVNAAV